MCCVTSASSVCIPVPGGLSWHGGSARRGCPRSRGWGRLEAAQAAQSSAFCIFLVGSLCTPYAGARVFRFLTNSVAFGYFYVGWHKRHMLEYF